MMILNFTEYSKLFESIGSNKYYIFKDPSFTAQEFINISLETTKDIFNQLNKNGELLIDIESNNFEAVYNITLSEEDEEDSLFNTFNIFEKSTISINQPRYFTRGSELTRAARRISTIFKHDSKLKYADLVEKEDGVSVYIILPDGYSIDECLMKLCSKLSEYVIGIDKIDEELNLSDINLLTLISKSQDIEKERILTKIERTIFKQSIFNYLKHIHTEEVINLDQYNNTINHEIDSILNSNEDINSKLKLIKPIIKKLLIESNSRRIEELEAANGLVKIFRYFRDNSQLMTLIKSI